MAIEKNNFKASRFDPGFSPVDMYSDGDDEVRARFDRFGGESDEDIDGDGEDEESGDEEDDEDEEFNDADSGAGSDDFDLLELGDPGAEFCQVGSMTCSVPFELYDLTGLEDVLSMDVWNEVLSEEEKFRLSKLLPDMDQLTFMQTLKELFEGKNFHFGSPVKRLFEMLKGGQCEPRVALYRQGLSSFQRRQHYHWLRNYHNTMVGSLCQIRDAWASCKGYSIEEKLRVLNIMKTQKSLMHEKAEEGLESGMLEEEELGDGAWAKRMKDKRGAQKLGPSSTYGVGPSPKFASRMPLVGMELVKHGKKNSKGIPKLAGPGKELVDRFPFADRRAYMNSSLDGSAAPVPQPSRAMRHGKGLRQGGKMRIDYDDDEADAVDAIYGLGFQGNQHEVRSSGIGGKSRVLKAGRNQDPLRNKVLASDDFVSSAFENEFSNPYAQIRSANQHPEVKNFAARPSKVHGDFERRAKYPESIHQYAIGEQMKSFKGRAVQPPAVDNGFGLFDYSDPTWLRKSKGQIFPAQSSLEHEEWNLSSKMSKKGREPSHPNFPTYRASSLMAEDELLSELKTKSSKEKRPKLVQNGGSHREALRATYQKDDETESDSSEYFDRGDEDDSPFTKRRSAYAYPLSAGNDTRLSSMKSGLDAKKAKAVKQYMQEYEMAFNRLGHLPKVEDGCTELLPVAGLSSKGKMKGTYQNNSPLHNSSIRVLVDNSPFNMGKSMNVDERKHMQKMVENGRLRAEVARSVHVSSSKVHSSDRKQKGEVNRYDTVVGDEILRDDQFQVNENVPNRTVKKRYKADTESHDTFDRSEASLQGCSSVTKKRKLKQEPAMEMSGRDDTGNLQPIFHETADEQSALKKKGKRKLESDTNVIGVDSLGPPSGGGGAPALVVEPETKPQKKPYIPITPTVHTGFSFSIVHLLSAVRMAMITAPPEVSLDVGKQKEEPNEKKEGDCNDVIPQDNADSKSEKASQACLPAVSAPELVNRVRSNPGDPCVLETQVPLQDLVRGVLKLFSSKTAPLGAKGWKALVTYEKSNKSWLWIGPASQTPTNHEANEEVTSPDYWGVPHKMLVKLVDAFANWLKASQETLKQIGSLPAPPLSLMQGNLDEKERFKDLRAQKSLNTISPSSEEVRDYFRKEEFLRYSVPDRAFSYTAADGKKSIVAPLRRCGGKPNSKARDHFMLKKDRPPHVTILCLVRDAAARLPGSIGTRADVCTLIRDSQYIVEDISDAQVNQIVSGALDRLHYERDPCVQYDGERKLWVYLHRDREEEDFEDDGTSSTKKWKRPKKDSNEQSDQGTVTVAFHGTGDQLGTDMGSDNNIDQRGADCDKKEDNMEDKADKNMGPDQGNMDQGDPTAWDALNLNPVTENQIICEENSTNEDFGDETFGRDGPVEIIGASLL